MEENWEEYLREVLEEIREEARESGSLLRFMRGVRFLSRKKGKKRKRKHPCEVILLQYGSDWLTGRHRSWTGEDRTDRGRIPWDEWATEVLGADFCDQLSQRGIHPDDYLRGEVLRILRERRGKF